MGWKKIWDIKAMPRVHIFVWRVCSDALPTKVNLMRRGGKDDTICALCGEASETIDHLLLRCPMVIPIWYGSKARLNVLQGSHNTFKELLWNCMEHFPTEYVSLIAHIVSEIWYHRNAAIFEHHSFVFSDVILKAERRWWEFHNSREEEIVEERKKRVKQKWEKPARNTCKLNSDVAVWSDGRIGLGFALRDDEGNVVLAAKMEVQVEGSSTLLEGLALRYALEMIRQYHMTVDQIECDNCSIVGCIAGNIQPEIYCDIIVMDIQKLMMELGCSELRYISRTTNNVAHMIAHGPDFISIKKNPDHIIFALANDVIDV